MNAKWVFCLLHTNNAMEKSSNVDYKNGIFKPTTYCPLLKFLKNIKLMLSVFFGTLDVFTHINQKSAAYAGNWFNLLNVLVDCVQWLTIGTAILIWCYKLAQTIEYIYRFFVNRSKFFNYKWLNTCVWFETVVSWTCSWTMFTYDSKICVLNSKYDQTNLPHVQLPYFEL